MITPQFQIGDIVYIRPYDEIPLVVTVNYREDNKIGVIWFDDKERLCDAWFNEKILTPWP